MAPFHTITGERAMFEPTTVFGAELQTLPPSAATGPDVPRPKRRSHGRLQRLCELYGACDGMRTLFDTLDKIADASATVIVSSVSNNVRIPSHAP